MKDTIFVNWRDNKGYQKALASGYMVAGRTDKGFIMALPGEPFECVQEEQKRRESRRRPKTHPQTPKGKRGRPRHWPEAMVNKTHKFTPQAHAWIAKNRRRIEELAHQGKLF